MRVLNAKMTKIHLLIYCERWSEDINTFQILDAFENKQHCINVLKQEATQRGIPMKPAGESAEWNDDSMYYQLYIKTMEVR